MSHAVNRATVPAAEGGAVAEPDEAATAGASAVDDGCIDTAPGKPCKPMRADAVRNRELLTITAARAFEERGAEAPLEDIAKRAGVGIGTLYRHFPTRDALLEAVYRREVETLCDGVDALRREHEPVDALSQWMRAFVVYVARKRGMAMALKAALGPENALFAESHDRIRGSLTALVGDAVAARQIRDDVEPLDLMRAMSGICMAVDPAAGGAAAVAANASTTRIVDLLLDGLRFGAATSTTAPAPAAPAPAAPTPAAPVTDNLGASS